MRQTGPQESADVMSSAGLLISSEGANSTGKPVVVPTSPRDLSSSTPRLLVRSDSFGGDTKLMNKLNNFHMNDGKCAKTLLFNEVDVKESSGGDGNAETGSQDDELQTSNTELNQLTSPAK